MGPQTPPHGFPPNGGRLGSGTGPFQGGPFSGRGFEQNSFAGPYHEHAHRGHWWLLGVLILLGIVVLVSWLTAKYVQRRGVAPMIAASAADSSTEAALAELRMRYARGEVDRDTFLQASGDLTGQPAPPPPAEPTPA